MSNSPVLSRPFKGDHARGHVIDIAEAGRKVVQLVDRLSDHGTARKLLLDCYREGWAEANLTKILAATTPRYRFHDPLVGSFSRWSLYDYFDHVQDRLSRSGAIGLQDMAFFLRGRMGACPTDFSFGGRRPKSGLLG